MVERYAVAYTDWHADPEGGFVDYNDYAALKAENEQLKRALAERAGAGKVKALEAPSREKFYYPIVMPITKDGFGPADLKDAEKLTWEVWDQELSTHGSFDYLPDAIDLASKLNARRAREQGGA